MERRERRVSDAELTGLSTVSKALHVETRGEKARDRQHRGEERKIEKGRRVQQRSSRSCLPLESRADIEETT